MSPQFKEMEKQMFVLYGSKDFAGAYTLIEQMLKEYPSRSGIIYNYAYSVKNLMGDREGALQLMEEAAENGYWVNLDLLQRDPDLLNLQNETRFKEVLKKYATLAAKSRQSQRPLLITVEPDKEKSLQSEKIPLVIALHGNTETAEDALAQWKFLSEKGWLVALPQSSQAAMPNAYVWDNFSVATQEIKEHYMTLKSKYSIDENRIILAGFSKGGALAATLCFKQVVPARRFVLMGPYLQNPAELKDSIKEFSLHNGRGYLVVGEKDAECIEGTKTLFNMLKNNGIECRIDLVPDIAHEYPENFQGMMEKNIDFLLGDLS